MRRRARAAHHRIADERIYALAIDAQNRFRSFRKLIDPHADEMTYLGGFFDAAVRCGADFTEDDRNAFERAAVSRT